MTKFYFKIKFIESNIILCMVYLFLSLYYKWDELFRDIMLAIFSLILIPYFYKYVIRLFAIYRKIPGLIVTDELIHDHQSGLTFLWKDIASYYLSGSVVVIEMMNAKDYIRLMKNPVRRVFSSVYFRIFRKATFRFNIGHYNELEESIFEQLREYEGLQGGYPAELMIID